MIASIKNLITITIIYLINLDETYAGFDLEKCIENIKSLEFNEKFDYYDSGIVLQKTGYNLYSLSDVGLYSRYLYEMFSRILSPVQFCNFNLECTNEIDKEFVDVRTMFKEHKDSDTILENEDSNTEYEDSNTEQKDSDTRNEETEIKNLQKKQFDRSHHQTLTGRKKDFINYVIQQSKNLEVKDVRIFCESLVTEPENLTIVNLLDKLHPNYKKNDCIAGLNHYGILDSFNVYSVINLIHSFGNGSSLLLKRTDDVAVQYFMYTCEVIDKELKKSKNEFIKNHPNNSDLMNKYLEDVTDGLLDENEKLDNAENEKLDNAVYNELVKNTIQFIQRIKLNREDFCIIYDGISKKSINERTDYFENSDENNFYLL